MAVGGPLHGPARVEIVPRGHAQPPLQGVRGEQLGLPQGLHLCQALLIDTQHCHTCQHFVTGKLVILYQSSIEVLSFSNKVFLKIKSLKKKIELLTEGGPLPVRGPPH